MCTITHFFDKSKFFCLDNIHIGLSCRWSGTKKPAGTNVVPNGINSAPQSVILTAYRQTSRDKACNA